MISRNVSLGLFGLLLALPGCATITEGTTQSVTIFSSPNGASCDVDRNGARLASVARSPESVNIPKSKDDLHVACSMPGYEVAVVDVTPRFVGTTFGNVILGGVVGAIVDASTGANYALPGTIVVPMFEVARPRVPSPAAQDEPYQEPGV